MRAGGKKTPEVIDDILYRIAETDEPLCDICNGQGEMPALSTWYLWCEEDAELAGRFTRARIAEAERIRLEAKRLADAPAEYTATAYGKSVDKGEVALRRLRVDVCMKLADNLTSRFDGRNGQNIHTSNPLSPAYIPPNVDEREASRIYQDAVGK
jgi:hypothetical protein